MTQSTKTNPFATLSYAEPFGSPWFWRSLFAQCRLDDSTENIFHKAIHKMIMGADLAAQEIEILKQYLDYFLSAPAWKMDFEVNELKPELEAIDSREDLNIFLEKTKQLKLRIF